ncbi:HAD family phosphatase [Fervidobacterium sp. 2310opik-2]|uniref:HAD family hydrolase n=1 Tax=Fervidobacterium sp. 2310opik-2 TaxID=1755815 RepID=UPI0013E0C4FF|nr:HAD family phosphatase [Fervidobacterium sp. 2310opik-2]KAF2961443.1 haloacid dehalogenase [Fervidobacterium sp. 2310opik-2]HOJ93843.1 HAD family phosphatase [Fervidobacterium nodosum]
METRRIKNVVFDLGRVLIDWQPYEYMIKKFGKETAEFLERVIFNSKEWNLMDKGIINEHELWNLFIYKHPEYKIPIEHLKENVTNLLIEIKDNTKLLEPLKAMGYKLYVLSNFSEMNFAYVYRKYDFFKKFDGMVISSHVKQIKPDKEIFEILIERYNIIPQESLFVDDRLENIQTAEILGFEFIHLTDHTKLREELERKLNIKFDEHNLTGEQYETTAKCSKQSI